MKISLFRRIEDDISILLFGISGNSLTNTILNRQERRFEMYTAIYGAIGAFHSSF